jgi:uncharacterized protein
MDLFSEKMIVGVFRGFSQGGLEFHADLVLPYRNDFQSIPMHGQFLLVRLESEDEAVLGRITSLSSGGKLASGSGEEFNIRAVRENRSVPEDLREQYLRYKIDIRVLGVVRRKENSELTFVASHRRLPHVGSPVAFLSDEVLKELAGHNQGNAPGIGHFALGEYVYAQGSKDLRKEDWLQVKSPEVLVKFSVSNLVSRRSFIFARAGFGKSNLNKLLFSELYKETPTVEKRNGRQVPVGTILFDPDGEYFWPDDKGRPGLCDVPELEDKLVVFTNRRGPSEFYQSFVAGGIRLDVRRLKPSDVISIALSPERQDQQNVRKLRGLGHEKWEELVNIISKDGHSTDIKKVQSILQLDDRQDAEAYAARANMTTIIQMLHDKSSQLMDRLLAALSEGKLCIVDVSQMRGGAALILSSLILRRIFDRNQEEFTAAEPKTIPTIAVIEEAQSVLNEKSTGTEPYIAWVKEGRKYDLGAVMITQQPGSIPVEILSQGDNWFIFHLLSASDLASVRRANAHFSDDILSVLLNEPIPGHGVFWSSASPQPYPISIRAISFEDKYQRRDVNYKLPAAETYASRLRKKFEEGLNRLVGETKIISIDQEPTYSGENREEDYFETDSADVLELIRLEAVRKVKEDKNVNDFLKREQGWAWGSIKARLLDHLPEMLDDRDTIAFNLVPTVLNEVLGEGIWEGYRNEEKGTKWVRSKPKK